MLKFKNITIKNFLSVGQVTQSLNFENQDLILVLGENLDLGGLDNRNGVGKSLIINAICYALYGVAINNIRKSNLVNKTNEKNMLVTLEFDVDGHSYRIERGRSPNNLAFYTDGAQFNQGQETDEAQGENRLTQAEIERVIGLPLPIFKNIVVLNTYTEPFLSMRAHDQREIIENLLGITKLSEKAAALKEHVRSTKDLIKQEEFRISAVREANKRIEENIRALLVKSQAWDQKHAASIQDINQALLLLNDLDVDQEIELHQQKTQIQEQLRVKTQFQQQVQQAKQQIKKIDRQLEDLSKQTTSTSQGSCPTCGHSLDKHKSQTIQAQIQAQVSVLEPQKQDLVQQLDQAQTQLDQLPDIPSMPTTFYDDVGEAYNHRQSIASLNQSLEQEQNQVNPYVDQIQDLKQNGIQEIDFENINQLSKLKDHQEFLLKLLTSKDSFIRKKIIDQNLSYLNHRLRMHLDKMSLPHQVVFQNDLSVEISEHGRSLDYHNLSRGEGTRLILGLSMAFRDMYESLNRPISLLFIDELIDSGLDTSGVEAALKSLKAVSRDQGKSIYLISHRDELIGRVDRVLKVVKEGGFTSFDDNTD